MMNYLVARKNQLILIFTLAYLAAFTANAIFWANFEFLYYTFLISILIYSVIIIHQNLHLGFFILVNLSLLGFFHLLGGNFYFYGLRLYDFYFIPGIIRYDNFVHAYGTFIATVAFYSLLSNFISIDLKKRYPIFALILILLAIGMGTIVELVEFLAVVIFGVTGKVGDYFNNTLDLFFNTLGATLATVVIYFYRERPQFIKKLNGENQDSH